MDIINLKEEERFIEEYVNLRNRHLDFLLTAPISVPETKKCLKSDRLEIMGVVQEDGLMGVVILYLDRDGEVAFFARHANKGTGTELISIIEKVAQERGLSSIWAWVLEDNSIAQHVFEKKGFVRLGMSRREYKGSVKYGINYQKKL